MSSAFIIKSARIETLSILLKNGEIETLTSQLKASAADFANLKGMPFLLDVHQLPDPWGLDIKAVWKCFAEYQVRIIGIRHTEADYEAKVLQYGLPFILISNKEKDAAQPVKPVQTTTMQPQQSQVQQEQVERLKNQVLQLKQQLQQASSQQSSVQQEQLQRLKEQVLQLKRELQQSQTQPQTIMQQEQVDRLKEQILQLKQSLQQAEQAHSQVQQELQQAKQEIQQAKERQPETVQQKPQQPVQRNLPTSSPTITVDKPVRSGQQVYAEGGDVICTALVSQGAEIIADGNIHIYAPFRGRALAGASGDKTARIFIHSMEGQLISIAGIYRIFDKELPASLSGKSVVVSLDGGKLNITALGSH